MAGAWPGLVVRRARDERRAWALLGSFVGILWGLSGALSVPIGAGVAIPGYRVWVAIAYALIGTWITHRLGRPLIDLNGEQQKVEADFRYALVQVRDHAEAIALARGEPREHVRLSTGFEAIRANWFALIRTTKRLTWFSAGYGQVANVFPILAAAPRYFSGGLKLGGLMQTAQAFGQVQGALSWRRACPQTTIVSVGHRSTLTGLHDTFWSIGAPAAPAAGAGKALRVPGGRSRRRAVVL